MAVNGPKCLEHDSYVPCPLCRERARRELEAEQLRLVSYEEWKAKHPTVKPEHTK